MHRIALAYLLIFSALNFGFILPRAADINEKTSTSTIRWNEDTPLSWYDFKGKAKNMNGISALTASAIEYAYDCNRNELKLDVHAIFIPEESWVKTEAKTDYILAHEQLHFDITEIYARKLRKALSREVRSCQDVWKIDRIARKLIQEWKEVQDDYDKDTHHSINRELQDMWTEKVQRHLMAHEHYALENWKSKK